MLSDSGHLTRPSMKSSPLSDRSTRISGNESGAGHQPGHRSVPRDRKLAEQLSTAEEVWILLVVPGEMKAGFHGGAQQRRNESLLNRLLAKPTEGVKKSV